MQKQKFGITYPNMLFCGNHTAPHPSRKNRALTLHALNASECTM
jgi:hypothetical protein